MKKLICLTLVLMMALSLTACGKSDTAAPPSNSPAAEEDKLAPAAESYAFSYGGSASDSDPTSVGGYEMLSKIEELSNGAIKTQAFFNGTMGNDREVIEAVQMGQLNAGATSSTQMTNFVLAMNVFDVPFAFASEEQFLKLMEDEDFTSYLDGEFQKVGLKMLGFSFTGFRTLTANKAVRTAEDLKGLDIRVTETEIPMTLWRSLGANPTPISFTEVYAALQQGVVDAQENPISFIHSMRFYEQQKYIVYTNHTPCPIFWVANLDYYNSLPEDLQTAIMDAAAIGTQTATEKTAALTSDMCAEMEAAGCEFITISPEELAKMREASQPAWDLISNSYPEAYGQFTAALSRQGIA